VAAAVISSTVLHLPASVLGPESPLPEFHSLQRLPDSSRSPGIPDDMRRRIEWGRLDAPLPYPLQADYELEPVLADVPAVRMANDRVEAVALPQYGGRIWSLRQLSSGRDLVYRNPVLSWANLGLTNAWFAGGVEWNLGSTGHSATTARPLFAASVETAYGPVLRVWEWERTRDLVFSVDLSLPAGSDFLYASVRVRNPDGWVKPLYWWTNVAVAETPGVRVLAPASQAWRTSYDGVLDSVAMPRPEGAGTDASYPDRAEHPADYFFQIEPRRRKWIAALGADGAGVVHTSTAGLPGRKLFFWGVGTGGNRWQERLSGPGSRYLEIQAGLATTQLEHLELEAAGQVSWTEAIGPLSLNTRNVHQGWAAAGQVLEAGLDELLPARDVEDFHQRWLASVADRQPAAPLHLGSGFGSAELAVRRLPADFFPATPFAAAGRDGSRHLHALLQGREVDADLAAAELPIPPITEAWQPYFENASRSWWACLMLAIRAHAAAEFELARRRYHESLALKPSMLALRGLAVISSAEGDRGTAADLYLAAVALDPQCRLLLVEAVDALLLADRSATALELIGAAPAHVAKHGRVVLQHVRALLAAGDRAAAARLLLDGIDVPDLREGESLENVWRLACPGVDLPARYDFRMHPAGAGAHEPLPTSPTDPGPNPVTA
jgi:hypothetical protein